MKKEKVLFNHDAAIDEFMAAVLLTTMKEVDYLGSVIMNADCIYWQGTLFEDNKNGRAVDVILNMVDSDGFYNYVLQQFRK